MSFDTRYPSVELLREKARRRMPGFAFDYLDGGCNEDINIARNTRELREVQLAAIHNKNVFEQLMEAVKSNYEGFERERQMIRNRAPKFGNGDPYVDDIAKEIAEINESASVMSSSGSKVHGSADDLSRLASKLNEMVERFIIK